MDPVTAFRVFTAEIDRWWVRGPINFYDSTRAVGMRCESGVGGRLIELYDATTGEGLELGRITTWEPGEVVAWKSSVDDVEINVRFLPIEVGTRVVVEAFVPEGGRDRGGSAWMRVAPTWFGAWCAQRDAAPSAHPPLSRLAVAVAYRNPAAAARWIRDVLGLEPTLSLPDDDDVEEAWFEFRVGTGILVVSGAQPEDVPEGIAARSHTPWVFVDDLERHHADASASGAVIVEDIHHHGYRAYTIEDPEGHHWTIAQALPSVHHASVS